MGWRGKDGTEHLRGDPNPRQWEMYARNNCVFQYHMPEDQQYMRNWNQPYLDFAKDKGWRQRNDPVQLAIYSDTLQAFRLAARRARARVASRRSTCASASPPTSIRCRSGMRRWRPPASTPTAYPWRRSPSGRWRCTTMGFAERLAAPDPQPQLPGREPRAPRRKLASRTAAGPG